MNGLTPKQRAHLRRLAHHLKAVVHVGSDGVTPAVLAAVLDAFNTRELIKVKVQEAAPRPVRESSDEIAAALEGVHGVHTIGRTAILYREHPDDPEIRLPQAASAGDPAQR
jgi:RNA-binding protein